MIALEKPAEISRFKASYRNGHAVATVNRALGVLRAAINWGRFQDPPLLATSPFHRFGVNIKVRDETKRDRRIHRDEEQSLLEACLTMNSAEHKWKGPAMHDRIIGALETCCRQGEMLRIQNRAVDWTQHQILTLTFETKGTCWVLFDQREFDRPMSCCAQNIPNRDHEQHGAISEAIDHQADWGSTHTL